MSVPSKILFDRVSAWRDAAIADGWQVEATYRNESAGRAATLRKDGFVAQVITREAELGRQCWLSSLYVWAPDRLAINVPDVYDWDRISSGIRKCGYCPAKDVDTHQVGFAGRCCSKCLPKVQRDFEVGNWTS